MARLYLLPRNLLTLSPLAHSPLAARRLKSQVFGATFQSFCCGRRGRPSRSEMRQAEPRRGKAGRGEGRQVALVNRSTHPVSRGHRVFRRLPWRKIWQAFARRAAPKLFTSRKSTRANLTQPKRRQAQLYIDAFEPIFHFTSRH